MYIGIRMPEHHLHHLSIVKVCDGHQDSLDVYKRAAAATAAAVAFWRKPITLQFGGLKRFEPPFVWYTEVESENLLEFFPILVESLQYYGVEFRTHEEFVPHVTLSKWPKQPRNPYEGQQLEVSQITLVSTTYGDTNFYL